MKTLLFLLMLTTLSIADEPEIIDRSNDRTYVTKFYYSMFNLCIYSFETPVHRFCRETKETLEFRDNGEVLINNKRVRSIKQISEFIKEYYIRNADD